MPDTRRSPEAQAYRHLYKSAAWLKGRLAYLSQHPLCERCQAQGRVTAATVVNHRTLHKGDVALFFDWANWEAICKPHHDSSAQSDDRRGYSTEIGADGWPTSASHPANRTRWGEGQQNPPNFCRKDRCGNSAIINAPKKG